MRKHIRLHVGPRGLLLFFVAGLSFLLSSCSFGKKVLSNDGAVIDILIVNIAKLSSSSATLSSLPQDQVQREREYFKKNAHAVARQVVAYQSLGNFYKTKARREFYFGHLIEARASARKALEIYPFDKEIQTMLSKPPTAFNTTGSLKKDRLYRSAVRSLKGQKRRVKKIESSAPEDNLYQEALVISLVRYKMLRLASRVVDDLLKRPGLASSPGLLYYKGLILSQPYFHITLAEKAEGISAAKAAYSASLEADPNYYPTLYALAVIYSYETIDYDQASTYLARAQAFGEKHKEPLSPLYFLFAHNAYMQGDAQQAIAYYKKIISITPAGSKERSQAQRNIDMLESSDGQASLG